MFKPIDSKNSPVAAVHKLRVAAVLCAFGLLALNSALSAGETDEPAPGVERVVALGAQPVAGNAEDDTVTIHVDDQPLERVLEYLSNVQRINIQALTDATKQMKVTVHLENVGYRAVLDFIAKKYGLLVETVDRKVITVTTPEKVSMAFTRADIRDVINTIALQSTSNIVVGPEVQGEITLNLTNVPWYDALDIVVKTLDFVTVKEAHDTIRITTPAKLTKQMETRIFRLAYQTPEAAKYTATMTSEFITRVAAEGSSKIGTTLIDMLAGIKSADAQVAFVKRGNTLVVTDTAKKLDTMQSIIDKLDIPPKQIHVAVKVVAISDNDSERLGVNWSAGLQFALSPVANWPSAFPFDVSDGITRSLLGDLAVAIGGRRVVDQVNGSVVGINDIFSLRRVANSGGDTIAGDAGFGFAGLNPITLGSMGFGATNAFFEMLRTKTSTRIIQSPQLMTLDNEEATIVIGDLIRYAESFVVSTEGGGFVSGFREASGSPIKEGFQLLIIPHVTGPENNILLTAIPKAENFLGFESFVGPDGIELRLPQTNQIITVNKMLLRNGETGVIGGLRVDTESRTQNHLPVLSEIPILGRLFKHRTKTTSGENTMIFVTPTIVDIEGQNDFEREFKKVRSEVSQPFAPIQGEEGQVE